MTRPPCQHTLPPGSDLCPQCGAPPAPPTAGVTMPGVRPEEGDESPTVFIPDPAAPGTLPPGGQPAIPGNGLAAGEAATVIIPDYSEATAIQAHSRMDHGSTRVGSGSGGESSSWKEKAASWQSLQAGDRLAGRYEILSMLGEGGMGAVYKAVDHELGREVAVKLIRPELAAQSDILERFKQEVIVARQITHGNVVRIYDLGSDGPLKFITMEYVEGEDLNQYMARTKPDIAQIASIFRQICEGLVAAHSANVVHRDLKPQNVMVTREGRAAVMDFGLALALEPGQAAKAGGIMGTPDYMSPEQAQGQTVDQRSDVFSLGLMFYQMLTQKLPFKRATMLDTLASRTMEKAAPPIQLNPAIPPALNRMVCKCLETAPADRYQSIAEILEDLDAWEEVQVPGSRAAQRRAKARAQAEAAVQGRLRRSYWLMAAAAVAMFAAGAYFYFNGGGRRTGPQTPVKLLIADFDNNSGEQVFDRTLEPIFSVALEGASFITAMNREQARKVGQEMQPGSPKLDEGLARLVAVREGFDVVLSGSIDKVGEGFTVSTRALDAVTGKLLAANKETAKKKEEVLAVVRVLAAPVRRSLGDVSSESAQMIAAETYTAGSMEAAHSYAVGQEQQYAGKFEDALRYYQMAVQLDPSFGRAYAGIAVVQRNLGRSKEAVENYKMALDRIDRMSERERYRTRGGYYVTIGQPEKAVQEFQALVNKYPADTAGHANLAVSYLSLRKIPEALAEGRKAIEIYPKNVAQRNNVAMFALYAGDYSMAVREAQEALKLNPAYPKAFLALALGQLAQGRVAEATQTYAKLRSLGALGASRASAGFADLALWQGRTSEAIDELTAGIAADEAASNAAGAAAKRVLQGVAFLTLGETKRAAAAAERAVASSADDDVRMLGGIVLARSGQIDKAMGVAASLEQDARPRSQARGRVLRGEALIQQKKFAEAVPLLQGSVALLDLWPAHFALGLAHLGAGDFAKAEEEFGICLKRGGETTSLLMDEIPTHSLLPPVHYYLGLALDGQKKPAAKEAFSRYLAMRGQGKDPMTADAASRVKP